MKIIFKATNIAEAHIVCGMLKANGVEAYVGGHYLQGGVGELASMDFANVRVIDEHIALAKEIIAEYDSRSEESQNHTITKKTAQTSTASFLLFSAMVTAILVMFYFLINSQ